MDQTDRRSAHRRVGAATIAAFLVLLLLGATRGPAQADTTVPATAAPTVEPSQTLPADPDPNTDPDRGFGHPRGDGGRFGGGAPDGGSSDGGFGGGAPDGGSSDGDGGFGGGAPDDGSSGGGATQAPSTSGGSQT